MVDMICHIASDTDWWGSDVEKGWTVVYIAGEDDAGVKERIEAWCVDHKDIMHGGYKWTEVTYWPTKVGKMHEI
jgi:hypothetical protein